jgi:hypothetical protein
MDDCQHGAKPYIPLENNMQHRRPLRIAILIILGLLGVVLYADVRSTHQIYRISEAMINNAPDASTRQHLIEEKDKRDREERREKMAVGAVLTIDVVLFLWLATDFSSRRKQASVGSA